MNHFSIKAYFENPYKILAFFGTKGLLNRLSDKNYLKVMFRGMIGTRLDLDHPRTFNEKIQWLKIHAVDPSYMDLVDKVEVRKYIARTIGEEYLIPLIGVWDTFEDIDFSKLPDQFVLKCTHDSGGLLICTDKSKLDKRAARKKINHFMRKNFYYLGREWPYKKIEPRILCEKYMVDESGVELKDYKFLCFNGEPKAMYVATNRRIDTRFDFYDMEFHHLPFTQDYQNSDRQIAKPESFDRMIGLARRLSKGIPHVRVDFYDINGRIYFGELTFYHLSGFQRFEPAEWDMIFGRWLELPPIGKTRMLETDSTDPSR